MTKATATAPVALTCENLDLIQGGLFTLDIGTTENAKSGKTKSVLIGDDGRDFVSGGEGNDLLIGGAGRDY